MHTAVRKTPARIRTKNLQAASQQTNLQDTVEAVTYLFNSKGSSKCSTHCFCIVAFIF